MLTLCATQITQFEVQRSWSSRPRHSCSWSGLVSCDLSNCDQLGSTFEWLIRSSIK